MAKVQRARWDGGPTVFADAIRHLCVSPNFLQYDEVDRVEDSAVHLDKVLAASPLLEVLYSLDPALNFKRKTVQDAYAIIASEKTKWDFDKQHKKTLVAVNGEKNHERVQGIETVSSQAGVLGFKPFIPSSWRRAGVAQ